MNDWAAYLPEPAIPGTTGNARRQSRTRRQRPDSLQRPLLGRPRTRSISLIILRTGLAPAGFSSALNQGFIAPWMLALRRSSAEPWRTPAPSAGKPGRI